MTTSEYEQFDNMMQRLIRVSHADIKAKLDAEKRAKQRKKKHEKVLKRKAKKNDTKKRDRS